MASEKEQAATPWKAARPTTEGRLRKERRPGEEEEGAATRKPTADVATAAEATTANPTEATAEEAAAGSAAAAAESTAVESETTA